MTGALAIVVIDPISSGTKYGVEGRRMGFRTIALLSRRSWPDQLGKFVSTEWFDIVHHLTTIAESAGFLRAHGVVAVLPGSPTALAIVDELAAALELPGNPVASASARSEKWAMKNRLVERGLRCPRYEAIPCRAEGSYGEGRVGFPLVVKPRQGMGGTGVRICRDQQELMNGLAAIDELDPCYRGSEGSSLIEELIEGEEYCMTVANLGNRSKRLISLARYEKRADTGRPAVYRNIRSMPIDDSRARLWFDYVADVNRALDVEYGINDTEFKAPAGEPTLIELNNRLPGANLPSLIERCTGINCYAENIRIFAGQEPSGLDRVVYDKHFCVCCLINDEARALERVSGLDAVKALPSFVGIDLVTPIGELAPKTVDFDTAWAFVYLVAADEDELEAASACVHSTLRF